MEAVLDQSPPTLTRLVVAARRGDRDAFRALVEPDLAAALGTARIVTRSEADASDAVQDAMLSAWRGLDSLRDPEAFRAASPRRAQGGTNDMASEPVDGTGQDASCRDDPRAGTDLGTRPVRAAVVQRSGPEPRQRGAGRWGNRSARCDRR